MAEKSIIREKPQELGLLSWDDSQSTHERHETHEIAVSRKERREAERKIKKRYEREVKAERTSYFPAPMYGPEGSNRKNSWRGRIRYIRKFRRATTHTFASAYPWVASGSLGVPGVCMGQDLMGGGGFYFDPWELYAAGVITGMSMILLGGVGTGKSTCAKCLVTRLVLAGRKALIMTDKKGEWVKVARYSGGQVISIGKRYGHVMNPLDEGNRPSKNAEGRSLTDEEWAEMVRERRLVLLNALCVITEGRELDSAEANVLSAALDDAVARAGEQGRVPIIPDLLWAVNNPVGLESMRESKKRAYQKLQNIWERLVEGDLKGMFDGESTVTFDPWAPMVVFNTSSFSTASDKAKKIAYACLQTWGEAAVTTDEYGQRVVVYEEGLEALNDQGSLERMATQVKLARAYGLFSILVLHKLKDLDMAGDEGSKDRATAYSLLGDSAIQVIYRQNASEKAATMEHLGITEKQWETISTLKQGQGLWLLEGRPFKVHNKMHSAEVPVFYTNEAMEVHEEEEVEVVA